MHLQRFACHYTAFGSTVVITLLILQCSQMSRHVFYPVTGLSPWPMDRLV
jgi:hypothetical protein